MDIHDYLSDDGHALLALCSAFGLSEDAVATGVEPFKLSEWNKLSRQIQDSPLKTPATLQGRTAGQLAKELSIPAEHAKRIAVLLGRSGQLALELENLFARG